MPLRKVPQVRIALSQTSKKDKAAYIELHYHYNGKRLKYSTGEKVYPGEWDARRQRAKSVKSNPFWQDINDNLDKLTILTRRIYKETNLGEIEPNDFKHRLDVLMGYAKERTAAPPPTLLTFAENFCNKYAADYPHRQSTYKVMFLTLKQLKGYAAENLLSLDFADINQDFLSDFILWMYAAPRQYRHNYVAGVVKRLKMFMQKAYEAGLHDNREFMGFKMTEIDSDEIALSFEELDRLYKFDISASDRLTRTKDVFLIGCFTGLRFGDYSRLKPDHIVQEGALKLISIITEKTGTKVKIPLFPILEGLLKKYDFNLPILNQTVFNQDIKEVCKLAGFTDTLILRERIGGQDVEVEVKKYEKVSTHTARRSFATNFILAGVPVHFVMSILGHKTEAQTRKYARISESQAAHGFSMEIEKLRENPNAAYLFK